MLDFKGCTVFKGDKVLIASRRGSNSYLFEAEVLDIYDEPHQQYVGWDVANNRASYHNYTVPMVRFKATESGRTFAERQDSYGSRLYVLQSAFGYHNDEVPV